VFGCYNRQIHRFQQAMTITTLVKVANFVLLALSGSQPCTPGCTPVPLAAASEHP